MKDTRKFPELAGMTVRVLALTAAGLFSAQFGNAQPPSPAAPASSSSKVLAWDADLKSASPKLGETVARFTFSVTNLSDDEVVIRDAKPSCGCTEATMPSKPWHLAAHSNGVINVGVNLAGKSGTIFKWVDVLYASNATKRLNLQVTIPSDPAMDRSRNQDLAKADRQAVFRGECAKCHVAPTVGKMGKDLYVAACDICHGANPRATMVPDLHAMNHSTDLNFWKVWIAGGKPGTLMPAFSKKEGGPLSQEQIDSLAEYMLQSIPPNMRATSVKSASLNPPPAAQKN
jgi:cytochrome c553